MANEKFVQIQKDIELLIGDVRNLIDDSLGEGAGQAKEITKESIAMLNETLEKCASVKDECIESGKNAILRASCCVQHRPILSLGLAALVGGIIGAAVSRRNYS